MDSPFARIARAEAKAQEAERMSELALEERESATKDMLEYFIKEHNLDHHGFFYEIDSGGIRVDYREFDSKGKVVYRRGYNTIEQTGILIRPNGEVLFKSTCYTIIPTEVLIEITIVAQMMKDQLSIEEGKQ